MSCWFLDYRSGKPWLNLRRVKQIIPNGRIEDSTWTMSIKPLVTAL